MFITQEIAYKTTGAVKQQKKLTVVYKAEQGRQYMQVVHIVYPGEQLPGAQYLILPPLEVTPSVFKDFDLMGRKMRGK